MRIRSTKPEFWRDRLDEGMALTVVFDGQLPLPRGGSRARGSRTYNFPSTCQNCEYVYLLFAADDHLLYVGRSWRPADRFTKHHQKPWWCRVRSVVIIRVEGKTRMDAEQLTRRLESLAITHLAPSMNIAAPSKKAMQS